MPLVQQQPTAGQQYFAPPLVPMQDQHSTVPPSAAVSSSALEIGTLLDASPTVVSGAQGVTKTMGSGKAKKITKCWKCVVDTHTTKGCPVQHYCLAVITGHIQLSGAQHFGFQDPQLLP